MGTVQLTPKKKTRIDLSITWSTGVVTPVPERTIASWQAAGDDQTVTVSVRDDRDNTWSKLVGWQVQRQLNFFESSAMTVEYLREHPEVGASYKFTLRALVGDAMRTYTGCFLENVEWSDLDIIEPCSTITATVRYDGVQEG